MTQLKAYHKCIYCLLSFAILTSSSGCSDAADSTVKLQARIDTLEIQLAHTYKPGFGEFMSSIQNHHTKLWFAGKNANWDLADFEIHELMEIFDDIQNYETDRMESRSIPIIYAPLDSINFAIQQKKQKLFQRDFNLLTNTCNACHREVNFGFNVVTIPQFNPFANQDFNPSH